MLIAFLSRNRCCQRSLVQIQKFSSSAKLNEKPDRRQQPPLHAKVNNLQNAQTNKLQYVKVNRLTGTDSGDWTPIYRFKSVKWVGFVARMKIWQTALVVTCVPFCYYLVRNGEMDDHVFRLSANLSIFAMLMLYVVTYFTQRVVGVISVSKDGATIRVGYLTFWGFRRDVMIPIDDVIPFSDMGDKPGDVYATIKLYSDPDFTLYLSRKKFTIVDEKVFLKVFGTLNI